MKRLLWLVGSLTLVLGAVATFRVGPPPVIRIEPGLPGIGRSTPVTVIVEESSRGVGRLEVSLAQGNSQWVLETGEHIQRPAWKFWGPRTPQDHREIDVGSDSVPELQEGSATIIALAWPARTWLRTPEPVREELALPVRLRPPTLEVRSIQHYVAQGGAGVVVYGLGQSAVRDGVEIGNRWFPGYPLPGSSAGERFALFAVPFDWNDGDQIRLVAEDEVLNRTSVRFVDRFFPRVLKRETIAITDSFMEGVVPAILEQTPELRSQGELLESYLAINGELRRRNGESLEELGAASPLEFTWSRPFLSLPNAQVMSAFADRRTYVYQGQEVDRQDHLGFDLASVRHAEVPAANHGLVVLSRYLGIYGNTVVIDHGFGLMSLYGHLSSLAVNEGQTVQRGQILGRTGETGLAGGDHLHFTMLVRGMPVDAVEWWDGRWIRDRVASKLGDALPFQP